MQRAWEGGSPPYEEGRILLTVQSFCEMFRFWCTQEEGWCEESTQIDNFHFDIHSGAPNRFNCDSTLWIVVHPTSKKASASLSWCVAHYRIKKCLSRLSRLPAVDQYPRRYLFNVKYQLHVLNFIQQHVFVLHGLCPLLMQAASWSCWSEYRRSSFMTSALRINPCR